VSLRKLVGRRRRRKMTTGKVFAERHKYEREGR